MFKSKKKPVTLINQGSYTWTSQFELIRHRRLAGETGFIEVLEVKNPPQGKGKYFIHSYHSLSLSSAFSEWSSLDNAMSAFDHTSGLTLHIAQEIRKGLPGFTEASECKPNEDPWFYTV